MYYFWKFLSIINTIFIMIFGLPFSFLMRIQFWLQRKMDPNFDPMMAFMQKAIGEEKSELNENNLTEMTEMTRILAEAISTQMKTKHPELVAEVQSLVDNKLKTISNRE